MLTTNLKQKKYKNKDGNPIVDQSYNSKSKKCTILLTDLNQSKQEKNSLNSEIITDND